MLGDVRSDALSIIADDELVCQHKIEHKYMVVRTAETREGVVNERSRTGTLRDDTMRACVRALTDDDDGREVQIT